MANDEISVLHEKIDKVAGYTHQIQVDIAEMKANARGETATVGQQLLAVGQRISALESWRDNVNRYVVGAVVGVLTTFVGALLLLLVKAAFKI